MAYPLPLESLLVPFERRTLHPWMGRGVRPIPTPELVYPALLGHTRAPRLAYLHVPFCANHCLFCGFYRNKSNEAAMTEYVDRLIDEIAQDGARAGMQSAPVEAVFFGGGTPSALSAQDLNRILKALRQHLLLAADCEITIEGRVAGFDDEKIDACLEGGANRFSIGIQTFDTKLRRRMGRKASREEAIAFLGGLVARDRAAVVCDLIYGLPGQTDELWRDDVSLCEEIGLDGVDLYCLTLHSGSPLALSIDKGALPPAADHETALRRYREGGEILDAAGWSRISQAHWRRTEREGNRYNNATKAGTDCLAFGAGAGGMLAGHRFMQDGDAANYQTRVAAGEKPLSGMLAPTPHHRVCGMVMEGLEAGVLDLQRLDRMVAEPGFVAALEPLLDYWTTQDLVRREQDSLHLTVTGRYWYNNIAAQLFMLIGTYIDGPQAAAPAGGHPDGHPAGIPRPVHPASKPQQGHPHEQRSHSA
ncbi:MAG: putative heme utilization radical SAM enzyme HutW [Candidatus Dactylopiibacterium carminicum]|uniref:Heme anaerobic degradation radical SAM methyltransferase ChuW/HutW n=1 Tax=Candidatus Dactylopiibacterium carminicum TaxID=857335 RepID=A0A272ESD4_9RHOO|nr:heme anaerobic degradation radical SAM methyltransferase ChuW/HutW [Candidatus Dactylopiibacterium carminicum]KAF7599019.1 heme anaerobic degradation radical SAM methyltransferase ChuW/HutW [Candidatus Dactylopiibacterium carminicum]PAS93024.1 MAG: putative heme utilization radical SAM enzyme HutW [Candidatus Dactylopiibacterium carminicum]PAS96698.1 MAG: putative heme utilization radical SAM enzyme HutW [Candidatus Dactylopiibacterium carminicum]PAS99033.1 MAG: putative heme utilization rad